MSRLADALNRIASRSGFPAGGLPGLTPDGPRRRRWRQGVALGMLLLVTSVGGALILGRGVQPLPTVPPRPAGVPTPPPAIPIAPAPSPADQSRDLVVQGLHAADSGALADAAAFFTSALKLNGADADAWNSLGVVQHRQGDTAAAVETFQRALRANPGHAGAHRNLGVILDGQGRPRDAASHYRVYLRLAPAADPARPAVVRRLGEMTASMSEP